MNKYKLANREGLTFLEVGIAISLFAVVMLGFFQLFNIAVNSSYRATRQIIVTNLCRGLMAEIMSKEFSDPEDPNNVALGLNAGEVSRSDFDDVDDYDDWSESPPITIGGDPMNGMGGSPNYLGFTRSVEVSYVNENMEFSPTATDYKEIVVAVTASFVKDAQIIGIKTPLSSGDVYYVQPNK